MSIINLIGNRFAPDYPALYMVYSSVMAEAQKRGGRFGCLVGRLIEVSASKTIIAQSQLEMLSEPVRFNRHNDDDHIYAHIQAPAASKIQEISLKTPTKKISQTMAIDVQALHDEESLFVIPKGDRLLDDYHGPIIAVPWCPQFKRDTSPTISIRWPFLKAQLEPATVPPPELRYTFLPGHGKPSAKPKRCIFP
jgi:hypothetical protein